MLTSKERANLRSISQTLDVVTQVGKQGICDALIESLQSAIDKREIIKINVLENSGLHPKEAGKIIAEKLGAEFVCATGRKLVFYKLSLKKGVKHIEF